jgi:hypothetical protein
MDGTFCGWGFTRGGTIPKKVPLMGMYYKKHIII